LPTPGLRQAPCSGLPGTSSRTEARFTNSASGWFGWFVAGARIERALGLCVAPSWRFERQSSGSRPLILPLDELGTRLRPATVHPSNEEESSLMDRSRRQESNLHSRAS